MADKQIGIKLDVRQTGLQQVDDALDTISKNLKDMNESVMKQQQRGWGSESQTKEMREQLRYMEQLTRMYERIARTQGKSSESFGNFRSEISGMRGDLGNVPSYSTGRVGGWVHQRFGADAAQNVDKLTAAIGKLGSMYAGFNLLSTLHSGMERGTQLAYGYGDIAKRMSPNTSAMSFGRDMLKGTQGYGYNDLSIMQSATDYGNVTGRMNAGDFKGQMQAIMSTGRRYGWDLGQTTSYFSDSYQKGITGGSEAQMNPQQFATLVANATVQAHMQGKEAQMMNQFSQVAQMSMQNMGQSGDAKTIAAVLAIGNKSGNQALMNNLPNMMSSINQGITNPSGGYAGQALMMRAIGGGKMGFWQEQFLQSQGAFGADENGTTNIEKATDYLMGAFKGDKYRQYAMLGQMFNLNPSQAKQYIDTYTKGGKFKSDALKDMRSQMDKTPSTINQSDTDKYRNNMMQGEHGANDAGYESLPERSVIEGAKGSVLDTGIGRFITDTSMLAGGAAVGATAYKYLSPFFKGKGGSVPKVSAPTTPSAPKVSTPTTPKAGGGLLSKFKFLGPVAEIMGTIIGADQVGKGGDSFGDFIFGHHSGQVKSGGGLFQNPFGAKETWQDDRAPIWSRLLGTDKKKAADESAFIGPPMPPGAKGHIAQESSGQGSSGQITGAELAPIVVSTIVALQPYMSQIRSVVDGGSNSKFSNPVYNGYAPTLSNPMMKSGMDSGFKLLSGSSPGSGLRTAGMRSGGKKSSAGGSSGSASSSAIDYWAAQYGVPDYVAYSIAMAESDLNPNAAGDNNTSFGLYQLHQGGGQGDGYTANQLKDPNLNAKIGLKEIARAYKAAKEKGIAEGPGMAEWVAQNSGHPGYGVHTELNDRIYNKAQSILNGSIQIKGGSIDVNIHTDSGTQTAKAPINAEYTGITA